MPYVRADPGTCAATPQRRLTPAEIQQHRDYRQVTRPAGVKAWMDNAGVDAVVYPGLLSDISLNDGGGGRAAFGRRDTPSAANGTPTIAIPAGINDHGQPVNIQLMGRAWDDARQVGFAYAFEHVASLDGNAHVTQMTAPPLRPEGSSHRDRRDDDHDRGRGKSDAAGSIDGAGRALRPAPLDGSPGQRLRLYAAGAFPPAPGFIPPCAAQLARL